MEKSILIVDDDHSMAKSLTDILRVKGYEAFIAYSGAEALNIVSENNIGLIITDVRMPDMNGVDLFRIVKKNHSDIPTILMTAYAADDIIRDGIREGIKTFLNKPLDIDFLLLLIYATLNH
jgi:DNA-binding NtrC family response regulator